MGEGLPEGTGLGTDLDGGMAEKFAAEYGADYGYIGRLSYYDLIISVSIDPANENTVGISWVSRPAEEAES